MVEHPILLGEAARVLEVSQETARRYADAGLLRMVRTKRGVRIFERADVERLARERAAPPRRRMIRSRLALLHGSDAFTERAQQLARRIADGEDVWADYSAALRTLAAIVAVPAATDARALLTTAQLAERLDVSPRTVRRRQAAGQLAPAQPGARGRAALWPTEAAR